MPRAIPVNVAKLPPGATPRPIRPRFVQQPPPTQVPSPIVTPIVTPVPVPVTVTQDSPQESK